MRTPALWIIFAVSLCAQAPDAGRGLFESQCARCHGPQGGGGELGPAIAARGCAIRPGVVGDHHFRQCPAGECPRSKCKAPN